jgi:hypothetical protein
MRTWERPSILAGTSWALISMSSGLRNACDMMIPTIKSYLNANNIPSKDVLFVEALVKLHPITAIGGFLLKETAFDQPGPTSYGVGHKKELPDIRGISVRGKRKAATGFPIA